MSLYGYKPKWKKRLDLRLDRAKAGTGPKYIKTEAGGARLHRSFIKSRRPETAAQDRIYNARVKVFLTEPGNTHCWCCKVRGFVPRRAKNIHHKHGRGWRRELLLVEELWIPCCNECHCWIHANPNAARKIGVLAELGKWNKT